MKRPDGLGYRQSLHRLMENGDPAQIEATAGRQERTVDAVLQRLFDVDPGQRRELVLLADEVGLGKTFVALGVAWSMLVQRRTDKLPARPILIVTPSSHALFRKWQREAETFFKQVVPEEQSFDVVPVETPHELVNAMRVRQSRLVLARMSAFEGQLHKYDEAISATLHGLFHYFDTSLSVDQRLALVGDRPSLNNRDAVDLRKSQAHWDEAESLEEVGFGERHIKRALRRLKAIDPSLIGRVEKSFQRVRRGEKPMTGFLTEIRELARASLGERVIGELPLVIVDEIHNWKNHPQSWWRFMHTFGGRIDRLLGLSATPFQLGSHELIQVLRIRDCLSLSAERRAELDNTVAQLRVHLDGAAEAGTRLRDSWAEVRGNDLPDIELAWDAHHRKPASPLQLPPRLQRSLTAALDVQTANRQLMATLRPFLVRHRRDISHRRWSIGRDATSSSSTNRPGTLQWRPGLDVADDAELVHYLMMRAVQEDKSGHGATSLGADLGGSYDFFRDHELKQLQNSECPSSKPYLALVEQATRGEGGHEHPKVKVTADRTFHAWRHGEKTLIFCFNLLTVDAVRQAVQQRIANYENDALSAAFNCNEAELPKRLANFQTRLYSYRQALFLLFQDHPLAGSAGRVPAPMALRPEDVQAIAHKLALGGSLKERNRFDRRRVLAATEQVLMVRWQSDESCAEWLNGLLDASGEQDIRAEYVASILAPDWPARRRSVFEGIRVGAESEPEPFESEDSDEAAEEHADPADIAAWMEVLDSHAGRAVLAPYLSVEEEIPSLLARWHADALHALPVAFRALASRMLRRMVRSPGFLARFLLDDPEARPALERGEDEADTHWTGLLHRRWNTPPAGGESAKDRFDAYLETLHKVVGREAGFAAYEDASRNREVVAKVTGSMNGIERDRHFTGFNTPLVPEVLIVTSVGQEGIDLHRECRHVIHHDLPWNPATLEQRTGRVDRIGSKAERLVTPESPRGCLDVVVPYIANTYDEYRFRKVHARSHLFEVTMGADYVVESKGQANDVMSDDKDTVVDDVNVEDSGTAMVALPAMIAEALRMRLEAVMES